MLGQKKIRFPFKQNGRYEEKKNHRSKRPSIMGTCFIFKLHAFGFHTKPNNRFEEEKNSYKKEKKNTLYYRTKPTNRTNNNPQIYV